MTSMYDVYSLRSNDENREGQKHDAGSEAETSRGRTREEHTMPMPSTPPQTMSAFPRTQFRDVTRLTAQGNVTGDASKSESNASIATSSSGNYTSRRVPLRQGIARSLRYDAVREAESKAVTSSTTHNSTSVAQKSVSGVSSPLQRRLGSESTARNAATRNAPQQQPLQQQIPRHLERRESTSQNDGGGMLNKPRIRSARAHKPLVSPSTPEEHMLSMTQDSAPPLTLPALQPASNEPSRRITTTTTTTGIGSTLGLGSTSNSHDGHAHVEWPTRNSDEGARHDMVSHLSSKNDSSAHMTLSQLPSLLTRGKPASQTRHIPLRRTHSESTMPPSTQDNNNKKSETTEPVLAPAPVAPTMSRHASMRAPPRLRLPRPPTTSIILSTTTSSSAHVQLREGQRDDEEEEDTKAAMTDNVVPTSTRQQEDKLAEANTTTANTTVQREKGGGGGPRWPGDAPETKRRRSSETNVCTTSATSKPRVTPAPWTCADALRYFADCLTSAEQKEMQQYNEIYYCGERAARSGLKTINTSAMNGGYMREAERYTDAEGYYRVTPGDHIAYRYEVIDILGHGNFATVVRAIDHGRKAQANNNTTSNASDMSFCALKVFRAGPVFAEAAAKETAMLTRLSRAVAEEEENEDEEESSTTPLAGSAGSQRHTKSSNDSTSSSSSSSRRSSADATHNNGSSSATRYFTASPLLAQFCFREHTIVVLPLYGMDLAEFMRVNEARPLPPALTQSVLAQLVYWLHILHDKAQVTHADIKPDNVVLVDRSGQDMAMPSFLVTSVSESHSTSHMESDTHVVRQREVEPIVTSRVALVDYGNAQPHDAPCVFPAQSLFYRAPEVALRLPYTSAMDMWSVGCILYELLTGRTMWLVESEQELLHRMLEVLGFPDETFREMLKRSWRAYRAARGQQQQLATNTSTTTDNAEEATMMAEVQALETCWRSFMQQLSIMAAASRQSSTNTTTTTTNTSTSAGEERGLHEVGHGPLATLLRALNFTPTPSTLPGAAYNTNTSHDCNNDETTAAAAHPATNEEMDEPLYSEAHVLLLDFLLGCLYWSAEERLTAHEALAHPYLAPLFTSTTSNTVKEPMGSGVGHHAHSGHSEMELMRSAVSERCSGMYFLAHHTLTATSVALLQAARIWYLCRNGCRRTRYSSSSGSMTSASLARHSVNNMTAVFTEKVEAANEGKEGHMKGVVQGSRTRVPSATQTTTAHPRLNVSRAVFPLQESAMRLVCTPCQAHLSIANTLLPCTAMMTTTTMSTISDDTHAMIMAAGGTQIDIRQQGSDNTNTNTYNNGGITPSATATTSPALYPIAAPLQISSSQNVLSLQYYLNATCVSRKSAYDIEAPLSFHGLYHTGPSFISGANTTPPWETEWGMKH